LCLPRRHARNRPGPLAAVAHPCSAYASRFKAAGTSTLRSSSRKPGPFLALARRRSAFCLTGCDSGTSRARERASSTANCPSRASAVPGSSFAAYDSPSSSARTMAVDRRKDLHFVVGNEHLLVFRPEVEVTVAAPRSTDMKDIVVRIEIAASSVLSREIIERGNG
jgi:hypothetical protein